MLLNPFKPALLLSLLLVIQGSTAWAQSSVSRSNASLQQLQQYQEQLADLETEFGPYDNRLVETLQAIEDLLQETGDLQAIEKIQGRRLQIMRTSLGFEHEDLIPVIDAIIDTQLRLGNWELVSEQLEHIRHLQSVNHGMESEQVLAAIAKQANFYLARVYLDSDEERASNLLEAREIYRDALNIAENLYGEDSPEIIPWLYRRAYNLYQLVAFMNTDDGLASATVDKVIFRDGMARLQSTGRSSGIDPASLFGPGRRIPVTMEGEPVGVRYLRQAAGFIDDIREIAERQGDLETQAMASIYYGDFQILQKRGSGQRNYREASALLLEAGIEQQRIDQLFSRPQVIPLENFYSRISGLEAYQRELLAGAEKEVGAGEADADTVHVGLFKAWEDGLPAVLKPTINDPASELAVTSSQVDLAFRINARGETSGVLAAEPQERSVERVAWRALRAVQFRPAFVDNRTRSTAKAQIRYLAPLSE
jgi:hypothetical protein